jgi:hypothetical protein
MSWRSAEISSALVAEVAVKFSRVRSVLCSLILFAITQVSKRRSGASSASVASSMTPVGCGCLDFDLTIAEDDDDAFLALVLSSALTDSRALESCTGGKRMASHFGHNIKSPCASFTERLLTLCGQGSSGKPSHLGITVSAVTRRMNESYRRQQYESRSTVGILARRSKSRSMIISHLQKEALNKPMMTA